MADSMMPANNAPSPLSVEALTHQAQRLRASADALDALAATIATATQAPAPVAPVPAPAPVAAAPVAAPASTNGMNLPPLAPLISVS